MISALLSVFFLTVVFGVALSLAIHYRQEKRRGLTITWAIICFIAVVIGLTATAYQYFYPQTIIQTSPPGRPYVIISDSDLEELTPGKKLVITFAVENTGPGEVTGFFKDVTCRFCYFPPQRYLRYMSGEVLKFKLVPKEKHTLRLEFSETLLDADKIKMIKDKTAELYFFGKGEFSDENGNKYPLPYCRKYNASIPNFLAICEEGITFTEPTYNDQ